MTDWRHSPVHLLLLAEFLTPRDPQEVCKQRKWQDVLGDALRETIRLFGRERLLIRCSLEEHLNYLFALPALQDLLKARFLPISGTRAILIDRLIEADREGMKRVVGNTFILHCSEQGQKLAEQYLAKERHARANAEAQAGNAIKRRQFKTACLIVADYEVGQVFPRGPRTDWERYTPDVDVAILQQLATGNPRVFAHLKNQQRDSLRFAASMMRLWGVHRATDWLLPGSQTGLPVDAAAAGRLFLACAMYQIRLEHFRQAHVKTVRVQTMSDPMVCSACQRLASTTYPIDKAPELPYEYCTCSEGCRCSLSPLNT